MSTMTERAFVGLTGLTILITAALAPAALSAQHGGGGGHGGGHGVALSHGGHVGGHGGFAFAAPGHHDVVHRDIVGHHNAIILHDDLVHHDIFVPHHGLHVGFVIGAPFYSIGYPYSGYWPYRARYRVPTPGSGGLTSFELLVEAAGAGVVRVTWPDGAAGIQEVGLFLADAGQQVLAVQTLRANPFTALFDVVAGTAYVGMTVTYGDGRQVTILVPYSR